MFGEQKSEKSGESVKIGIWDSHLEKDSEGLDAIALRQKHL